MANILRISDAASLAMHTMVMLAASQQQVLSTGHMAGTLKASKAHLAKVLQRLHRAGLVQSTRGPAGGFRLNRSGDQISLAEVYEAIEGPLLSSECLLSSPICDGSACILGDLVPALNARVKDYLAETMLSEVCGVFRTATDESD